MLNGLSDTDTSMPHVSPVFEQSLRNRK
ncbi:unnamed protein product, partial [Allacma fusca]